MKPAILIATLFVAGVAHAAPTKNPVGFIYDLPAGWQVTGAQGDFQVLTRTGQTQNEVYLVGGLLSFDARTPFDQELIEADEQFMTELNPAWYRAARPVRFGGPNGEGMLEKFASTVQGVEFDGLLFTTLLQKKRCGLLAIVDRDLPAGISERIQDECQRIVQSFRADQARNAGGGAAQQEWVSALAGYKLVRSTAENHGSQNGSGGSSGETSYTLYGDGTYQYLRHSMTFIGVGDFSTHSESRDEDNGQWEVHAEGGRAYLVLRSTKGETEYFELGVRGGYLTLGGTVYERSQL